MSDFWKDLEFGDKWEARAIQLLNLDFFRKIEGKFSPFDVVCVKDGKITFREFKADRIACKTGNLAIEWSCSKCPSGIQTTQADFWTYILVDGDTCEVYDIPVSVLKDLINRQEYSTIKAGGDNDKNIMFLFSKNIFSQYRINDNAGAEATLSGAEGKEA